MRNRPTIVLVMGSFLLLAVAPTWSGDAPSSKARTSKKKVLVELYTSQGCDSCPPASALLGRLEAMGYGPDRVVPIGFHVDYFNTPWVDPFSDKAFSRRQLEYNEVRKRDDLYFTPMMMVDGREPMLGSDRIKAITAIDRALREAPGVALDAKLAGEGASKTLKVELSNPSPQAAGRALIVGVAVVEGPITTRVRSGENAGKSLVEHFVVRSFTHKPAQLTKGAPISLNFPLQLQEGQVPARTRVSAFVQDQKDGAIYQADSVAWEPTARKTSKPLAPK